MRNRERTGWGESSVESSTRKETGMPLASNPLGAISRRWNRRGGGPEARLEKAKRRADAEAQRKTLDRQFDSRKDGRDVQSDRPS